MMAMCQHDWPGNVRELANSLEHALILAGENPITPDDLPVSLTRGGSGASQGTYQFKKDSTVKTLREIEMEVIHHVLDKHNGDKPKTAIELGIALKTLYNKLNSYQSQNQAIAG